MFYELYKCKLCNYSLHKLHDKRISQPFKKSEFFLLKYENSKSLKQSYVYRCRHPDDNCYRYPVPFV